ncbi:hypothetical protein LOK49_LG07G02845 [Camellia lanceoleosa]|uniref:Uncharacterized protein n=1 Tax=Camellia lanceoleosa TaxID=1840588 RepID=A0ACC0GYT6_9ERIC|nr:hypothetical protein LOK49_LG07G02845 [Camellia lanceoleosa]
MSLSVCDDGAYKMVLFENTQQSRLLSSCSLSLSPSRVSPSSLSLSHNDGADHPSPPILSHPRSSLTVARTSLSILLPYRRCCLPLSLSQTTLTVARPSPPLLPRRRSSLTADFEGNG